MNIAQIKKEYRDRLVSELAPDENDFIEASETIISLCEMIERLTDSRNDFLTYK